MPVGLLTSGSPSGHFMQHKQKLQLEHLNLHMCHPNSQDHSFWSKSHTDRVWSAPNRQQLLTGLNELYSQPAGGAGPPLTAPTFQDVSEGFCGCGICTGEAADTGGVYVPLSFSSKLLYVHLFIVFFTVSIITESKVACRPPVVMAMRVTQVWLHHLSIKSLECIDGLYCKHLFLEQH